jgi:hypothetical protein
MNIHAARSRRDFLATVGGQGRGRMGGGTNQAWADQKVEFYYAGAGEMLKQGFNDTEIGKIGGGKYCRVFDEATSVNV